MIERFKQKHITRGMGYSACAAVAYRSGAKIEDHYYGEIQDYTRKRGVVYSDILLPPEAPEEFKNRELLWNAVELSEKRKDSRLATELELGLPVEMSRKEQINLTTKYFTETCVDKGMIVDFSIHDKDDGNPHCHAMLTTRIVDPDAEFGFGKKNRDWNKKDVLYSRRKNWTESVKSEVERNGAYCPIHEQEVNPDE